MQSMRRKKELVNYQTQPREISNTLTKMRIKSTNQKKNLKQNKSKSKNTKKKSVKNVIQVENKEKEEQEYDVNDYNLPLKVSEVKTESQLRFKKRNPSVNNNLKRRNQSYFNKFISNSHTDSICLESPTVSHFSKNELENQIEEIKAISDKKGWVFEDTTCQLKKQGYIEAFVVSTH